MRLKPYGHSVNTLLQHIFRNDCIKIKKGGYISLDLVYRKINL